MKQIQYPPVALTCEYRENPIGIESVEPRFSWKMTGGGRNRRQTAYQILAGHTPSMEEICWDSGKTETSESVGITYGGPMLTSRERIYWKVRIWDEEGCVSPWSEAAFFEMGLLEARDWKGIWIAAEDEVSAPHFRKIWQTDEKPESARAYICGLGYYELYINGKRCGKQLLTPNRSDFKKHIYYHTYDITEYITEGKNAAGIILGNGWYNQKDKLNEKMLWYGYPKMLLQIELRYQNGTIDYIVSDTDMHWHTGPWVYNNIYFGEIFDARLKMPGWNTADFIEVGWKNAREAEAPGGRLKEQKAPSDSAVQELLPKTITQLQSGMYVVDFGQNITGWVRLKVSGNTGQKIQMRFGEELWPDGKVNYYSTGSGWNQQKDIYILCGEKTEVYEPAFTWHGFRYVEIQGFPGSLGKADLTAVVVRSGVRQTGTFTCSNAVINQIQHAGLWSLSGGMHCGMPLDSPHRERQGYGGDAWITAKACIYNFEMERFYAAWMDDFADAQDENSGFIPHTVPCQDGGGGPAWGSAYIVISWLCYWYYGDKRVLESHFGNMKRWMEFLKTGLEDGILEGEGADKGCLGEWSTPGEILIPPRFVNTYIYAYGAGLMAKIAEVLEKTEDAVAYRKIEKDTIEAFRREFYEEENGCYSIGAQGTEAFAYQMGAVHDEEIEKTAGFLAGHIEKDCNGNLDTGIFGTPCLFETLIDTDYGDTAYRMITSVTYPSYGYLLSKGATTLWEYWEPEYGFYQVASCHNQPMFGSISGCFYEKLAGIRPLEAAGKRMLIAPRPIGDLRFVSAKAETMYGTVTVDWERSDVDFHLYVSIPFNMTAEVVIPILWDCPSEYELDGQCISETGKKGACVRIGSGSYRFCMAKKEGGRYENQER